MEHVIPFLKKLKKNNNRPWFDAHREEYEMARAEFSGFVTGIVSGLKKFDKDLGDPDPSKTIFRIYRDIRFSKDKTPYKTHFAANINPGGKKVESPGYYLHVEPGDCFIVGGIYTPDTERLNKIRQEIEYHLSEFKKILNEKNFKRIYGSLLEDQKTKNPPRGFDKESPAMEFLKFKSYIVLHSFDEKKLSSKKLPGELVEKFRASYPLNKFLRRALG